MDSVARVTVGVVGAGAMGSGIALVAAAAGHAVRLADLDAGAVDRARDSMRQTLARDVAKSRVTQAAADATLARVTGVVASEHGIGTFDDCGVVIEAVLEDLAAKRDLFSALERVVRDECILATNTSSLSIAAIAAECRRPGRVIGVHFFNPAPVMPLVEIVPGIATDTQVTARAKSLVDGWGKVTVVASDTPGFIVNRVARPYYGESLRLLEEGVADAATIDWAMRELGRFRMGPFELMDFIGNDVNYAVTRSVYEGYYQDPRYRPAITQRRLVEAGMYGRKRGRGYFDYRAGAGIPEPVKDPVLGQAMVDRVVAMLVNEAVDAVHLRVASAHDIEIAMTKGVNYPRGLLAWGDEIGPATVLARLDALQSEYGEDRYRPSPLLRRRVRAGEPLLA